VLVALGVAIAGIVLWLIHQRERQALMQAARRELEAKVVERTAELSEVNAQLMAEGRKRQRSEERFRRSREELAQANRLATLGQISAGIAHEINQPVAAIRTFSENAAALIGRGATDKASANLKQVIELTDRIAQITGELRTFARRKTPDMAPVMLDEAIEAALLLVHHRTAAIGSEIAWDRVATRLTVTADRIRLEQVFVNLLQNALDAVVKDRASRIELRLHWEDSRVQVHFADNGRGVPETVRRKLFTPFATGREDGLGLGLAIARDILREFGGDLELTASDQSGSIFTATLVPA
jgi:two-component system C4-dicarboxylate transport sensor histidine kinase DctB